MPLPEPASRTLRWGVPILLACLHLGLLASPARQKVIGSYQTETDFYQYYAPDAERIAAWQFPESPYQGPGFATLVALASLVTGDPLVAGTWVSIVSAVAAGLMTGVLCRRLFGFWVGVATHALVPLMSAMPAVSISALTDLPFLAICLATLLVVVSGGNGAFVARAAAAGVLAGAACLVRYNGVFLIVACIAGIGVFNVFERPRSERFRLAAIVCGGFFLTISPWLYLNDLHRGSPFYNLNYLNIAIEFYDGSLSQDGTRAMAERFHSFQDVVAADPARIATHYGVNLVRSAGRMLTDLMPWWIGFMALAGLIQVLSRRLSKAMQFVLVSAALYVLMMALSHWEPRYYFLPLVIGVGLACHALATLMARAQAWRWISSGVAAAASVVLFAVVVGILAIEARARVADVLRDEPVELLDARRFIEATGRGGGRVLARKPHLAYISRAEWVFLPMVASLDELRGWLTTNRVDYLIIGPAEIVWRPALATLRMPAQSPAWLRPVWASGAHVLYVPAPAIGP